MVWWQWLLFPFAILYDLVTRGRNSLYDKNIIKPITFDTNVIVVGNLSMGGTGKTPFVSYLIRKFQSIGVQPGILTRGYMRKSKGFQIAQEGDSAGIIGDEPKMYKLNHPDIGVFIDSQRDLAIPQSLYYRPDTEVIIMDDGFQHRIVEPDIKLLLTTFQKPFYADYVLPSGKLRESRVNAKRADAIIVTKCPQSLNDGEMVKMREAISVYSSAQVYFTTIKYLNPKSIFDNGKKIKNKVLGISGIAEYQPFEGYLAQNFNCKLVHHYPDHFRYKRQDIRHIINELDEDTSLLTTEKDMVKLMEFEELSEYSCYYLPIEIRFLKDEALFISLLDQKLKKDVFDQDPL